MENCMDDPEKWASMQKNLNGNPSKKILWIMELAITQSFFELQTPDFAWKLIWNVPSKQASMQRKIGMESIQETKQNTNLQGNKNNVKRTKSTKN